MPEDEKKNETIEQQKAFELEKEKFDADRLNFARDKLIGIGYNEERANSINNLAVLNALYDDRKILNESQKEEEAKRAEAAKKEEKTSKVMKSNAGLPTITMPNGEVITAEENAGTRINSTIPEAHMHDPIHVARDFPLFRHNARPNPLPPTKEYPYERVI